MLRTSPIDDTSSPPNRLETIRQWVDPALTADGWLQNDFSVSNADVRFLLAEIDRLTDERDNLFCWMVDHGWPLLSLVDQCQRSALDIMIRKGGVPEMDKDFLSEHDRKYREVKP